MSCSWQRSGGSGPLIATLVLGGELNAVVSQASSWPYFSTPARGELSRVPATRSPPGKAPLGTTRFRRGQTTSLVSLPHGTGMPKTPGIPGGVQLDNLRTAVSNTGSRRDHLHGGPMPQYPSFTYRTLGSGRHPDAARNDDESSSRHTPQASHPMLFSTTLVIQLDIGAGLGRCSVRISASSACWLSRNPVSGSTVRRASHSLRCGRAAGAGRVAILVALSRYMWRAACAGHARGQRGTARANPGSSGQD